jgi:hypothetical protein
MSTSDVISLGFPRRSPAAATSGIYERNDTPAPPGRPAPRMATAEKVDAMNDTSGVSPCALDEAEGKPPVLSRRRGRNGS